MGRTEVKEILQYLREQNIEFKYFGREDCQVTGFSSLSQYKTGTFTWIKKIGKAAEHPEKIALAFVQQSRIEGVPNQIVTPVSKQAFFSTIEQFFMDKPSTGEAVGSGTFLSPEVKLGKNVRIGCNCVLDGAISIGDNCTIGHHVTIVNHVDIGNDCVIQSGTVIGHDGFAFTEDENGRKTMIRHCGGVQIGNDVWIATNVHIARGTIDNTVIGDNCKIDSSCHIAHNVVMEESCAVVAHGVIMGSVHVGKRAYISSCMIREQSAIGEKAFLGMGAVVTKDVAANTVVAGVPAKPLP